MCCVRQGYLQYLALSVRRALYVPLHPVLRDGGGGMVVAVLEVAPHHFDNIAAKNTSNH